MTFKCEAGKWLSDEEAADMLAYEEVGQRRPDAYADVIFDNTSGIRSGYRCKTDDEKSRVEAAAQATREAAVAADARRTRVMKEAGIDPATGVASRPQAFNTGVDLNPQDTGATGATGGAGESKADTKGGGKAEGSTGGTGN